MGKSICFNLFKYLRIKNGSATLRQNVWLILTIFICLLILLAAVLAAPITVLITARLENQMNPENQINKESRILSKLLN